MSDKTSDSKIYGNSLDGVGCSVSNCKYHTKNNACTAPGIAVQSENALRKAETFCGTFAPRSDSTSSSPSGSSRISSGSPDDVEDLNALS